MGSVETHISEREIVTDDDLKMLFLLQKSRSSLQNQVNSRLPTSSGILAQMWKTARVKELEMHPDGESIMAGSLLHLYLFPHR